MILPEWQGWVWGMRKAMINQSMLTYLSTRPTRLLICLSSASMTVVSPEARLLCFGSAWKDVDIFKVREIAYLHFFSILCLWIDCLFIRKKTSFDLYIVIITFTMPYHCSNLKLRQPPLEVLSYYPELRHISSCLMVAATLLRGILSKCSQLSIMYRI